MPWILIQIFLTHQTRSRVVRVHRDISPPPPQRHSSTGQPPDHRQRRPLPVLLLPHVRHAHLPAQRLHEELRPAGPGQPHLEHAGDEGQPVEASHRQHCAQWTVSGATPYWSSFEEKCCHGFCSESQVWPDTELKRKRASGQCQVQCNESAWEQRMVLREKKAICQSDSACGCNCAGKAMSCVFVSVVPVGMDVVPIRMKSGVDSYQFFSQFRV